MSSPTPAPPALPKLPVWTSATSVASFLSLAVGFVVAFIIALHPGWHEPVAITAVVPPAAILISSGVVLTFVILKRRVASAAGTPALPTFTDAASVLSYLTTIIGAVFALVTALHPGYKEPAVVNAILPTVATLVAAVSQLVNVSTHHAAVVAAHFEGHFLIGTENVATSPAIDYDELAAAIDPDELAAVIERHRALGHGAA